jgi:hypothetical protein
MQFQFSLITIALFTTLTFADPNNGDPQTPLGEV